MGEGFAVASHSCLFDVRIGLLIEICSSVRVGTLIVVRRLRLSQHLGALLTYG